MDEKEKSERDRVVAVAKEWIRTPFHDHGEVKGAGVDCAKLLKCVFVEAGLIQDFVIPYYSPQHFIHQGRQMFLSIVQRFAHEIPQENVQHGDVILHRVGKVFGHGAIVIGWPKIIHAHYAARMVIESPNGLNPHLGNPVHEVKFFSRW